MDDPDPRTEHRLGASGSDERLELRRGHVEAGDDLERTGTFLVEGDVVGKAHPARALARLERDGRLRGRLRVVPVDVLAVPTEHRERSVDALRIAVAEAEVLCPFDLCTFAQVSLL